MLTGVKAAGLPAAEPGIRCSVSNVRSLALPGASTVTAEEAAGSRRGTAGLAGHALPWVARITETVRKYLEDE